jgi:hypothetical protein
VRAHRGHEPPQLSGRLVEEAPQPGHAVAGIDRQEPLEAARIRLPLVLDLRGDADVARVRLAAAADGAAQGHHRHGAEPDPVCAQQHQLQHVGGGAHAAVRPQLHRSAQAGLGERAVGQGQAQVGGQARMAQGVAAGRAGAAVVARKRDHVGAGLGDADRDRADPAHDRNLHPHPRGRVGGAQLRDDLGKVLDRVQVVVVGG